MRQSTSSWPNQQGRALNKLLSGFLDADEHGLARRLGIGLAIYLGLHIWMRLAFSDTLQVDDTEQVVHGLTLALGYPFPQPPLYTWLSWGLFQLFEPSLTVLTALKYVQIAAMLYVMWRLTRYMFPEAQWRGAALLSFLLLPVFAWQMHVGFTHTVMMCLAISMTLHALLALGARAEGGRYAYLAVAIVLGAYAKFGYFLFLILLLAAASGVPRYRAMLFDRRMLWVVAACLLAMAPYYLWLAEHLAWVTSAVANKFVGEHRFSLGSLAALRVFRAALEFALPLLLVLLWAFPRAYRRIAGEMGDAERLLVLYHLLLLAIVLVLTAVKPLDYVKQRWMVTVLLPLPFWLLLRARRAYRGEPSGLRRYLGATLALTVLIVGVRLTDFVLGERLHSDGRVHLPVMNTLSLLPINPNGAAFLVDSTFEAAHVAIRFPGIPLHCPCSRHPAMAVSPPERLILLWTGEGEDKLSALHRHVSETMGLVPTDYHSVSSGSLRIPGDWRGYVIHYAEWQRTIRQP